MGAGYHHGPRKLTCPGPGDQRPPVLRQTYYFPAALRSAALMRSCQPGPPSWKCSSTSWSIRSDTSSLTPGSVAGFVPDILDRSVIDEIVKIDSLTAIETSRALARQEGIAGGISSGAAIAAALRIGRRPEAVGKTILAIVPSFSERYLSTLLFEGI